MQVAFEYRLCSHRKVETTFYETSESEVKLVKRPIYLRNGSPTGSDYVREVDEAVHSWRDNLLWRRYRVLWSEKYRNEFADAREEGERIGESRQLAQLSTLADRLEADGRTAELPRALRDEEFRQQLLRKYGFL